MTSLYSTTCFPRVVLLALLLGSHVLTVTSSVWDVIDPYEFSALNDQVSVNMDSSGRRVDRALQCPEVQELVKEGFLDLSFNLPDVQDDVLINNFVAAIRHNIEIRFSLDSESFEVNALMPYNLNQFEDLEVSFSCDEYDDESCSNCAIHMMADDSLSPVFAEEGVEAFDYVGKCKNAQMVPTYSNKDIKEFQPCNPCPVSQTTLCCNDVNNVIKDGSSAVTFYRCKRTFYQMYKRKYLECDEDKLECWTSDDKCYKRPKKKTCFAGSQMVQLESGEHIPMNMVNEGHRILVKKGQEYVFSDILFLPHAVNEIEARMIKLQTANNKELILSPDHILSAAPCQSPCFESRNCPPISAALIDPSSEYCVMDVSNVGDRVVASSFVDEKGIYSVIPVEGEYIVVNGIVSSPFAVHHHLGHMMYNIHRAWRYISPDSYSTYSDSIRDFQEYLSIASEQMGV